MRFETLASPSKLIGNNSGVASWPRKGVKMTVSSCLSEMDFSTELTTCSSGPTVSSITWKLSRGKILIFFNYFSYNLTTYSSSEALKKISLTIYILFSFEYFYKSRPLILQLLLNLTKIWSLCLKFLSDCINHLIKFSQTGDEWNSIMILHVCYFPDKSTEAPLLDNYN